MLFMSPEHVAAMNELLAGSDVVRQECQRLSRPRVLSYRLADGPAAMTVYWTISFSDTVQFSLEMPDTPDVVFVGDWGQMVRASKASRDGVQLDPGVSVEGDAAVLAEVGAALAAARAVATLPVEFPDV